MYSSWPWLGGKPDPSDSFAADRIARLFESKIDDAIADLEVEFEDLIENGDFDESVF